VSYWRIYYCTGIILVTSINFMVVIFYGDPDVLTPGVQTVFCAWQSSSSEVFFYTYTLPISIYFFSSLILCGHAVFVCFQTSSKIYSFIAVRNISSKRKYLESIWKSYGMAVMFLILYLIFFFPLVVSLPNFCFIPKNM
jgi:hypothetical protein